jgi:hypothetical protein
MLFKTLSASVYGIDAYLVEVEVDGGSARMSDFNVVGLPDNAVKESRERIKSALRNCGFEFPHGQGLTINLAPADVPKEGSACDLPMALGNDRLHGAFLRQSAGQVHVSERTLAARQCAARARSAVCGPGRARSGLEIRRRSRSKCARGAVVTSARPSSIGLWTVPRGRSSCRPGSCHFSTGTTRRP